MHDLKFPKLFPMGDWKSVETIYKSPACNNAARAYQTNILVTHSLAMVPGYAFMNGENWGYAVSRALRELNTLDMDDPRVAKLAGQYFDEKDMGKFGEQGIKHFHEATQNAATIATLEGRPVSHAALHTLLKSIIVQSWTSFEVLTEDLWERALNEHPHDLSKIKPPARDKDRPLIDPFVLQEYDFDIAKRMGTILKGGFRFHALNDIRLAYESSFSNGGAEVNSAINDKYIDVLYHLRNLIAHNTGIVDKHFLQETKAIALLKDIRAVGANKAIPFDGEIVRNLVSNGVRCGCALIKSVDNWITAHS